MQLHSPCSRVSFLDEPKATHYSRAASRRPAPIRSPYSFRESSSPYTALKDPIHAASCQSACAPSSFWFPNKRQGATGPASMLWLRRPALRVGAAKSRRVLLQPSTDWGLCTRLCRGPAPSALWPSNTAGEMYWGTGWVSCAGTQDELIKPMTDRCIKNCSAIRCRGASKFSSCD